MNCNASNNTERQMKLWSDSSTLGWSFAINIFPAWASRWGRRGLPPWWRPRWLACRGKWDHPHLSQSLWISLHELIKGMWLLPHGVLIASMHSLTPLDLAVDTIIKMESMESEKRQHCVFLCSPLYSVSYHCCCWRRKCWVELKMFPFTCVYWQSSEYSVRDSALCLGIRLPG